MKQILASPAPLIWQLTIRADYTVTNRAFCLALERPGHVFLPSKQPIDQRPIREVDNSLRRDEPTTPLLLVDTNTVDAFDGDLVERISRREADGDGHCLLVHVEAGSDFAGFGKDFDGQGLVVGDLGGDPRGDGCELGGDDEGRNVLLCPCLDCENYGAGFAVSPP